MHKLKRRPADRMWNFLLREGVQPSQPVTFSRTAGIPYGLPNSALVTAVSTFSIGSIAKRVQNLEQMIKDRPVPFEGPTNAALIKALHGAKWHLWHGCAYPALRRLESLGWDLEAEASPEGKTPRQARGVHCLSRQQSALHRELR
ncbi:hypothetical protein E1J61_35675 [Cupriavidus sp. L7L]|nr:hypothetical protein E1J61_35675 [Cupriavidus sp. L7L]